MQDRLVTYILQLTEQQRFIGALNILSLSCVCTLLGFVHFPGLPDFTSKERQAIIVKFRSLINQVSSRVCCSYPTLNINLRLNKSSCYAPVCNVFKGFTETNLHNCRPEQHIPQAIWPLHFFLKLSFIRYMETPLL